MYFLFRAVSAQPELHDEEARDDEKSRFVVEAHIDQLLEALDTDGRPLGFNSDRDAVPSVAFQGGGVALAALAGKRGGERGAGRRLQDVLRVGKERHATPSRHEAATVSVMVRIFFGRRRDELGAQWW